MDSTAIGMTLSRFGRGLRRRLFANQRGDLLRGGFRIEASHRLCGGGLPAFFQPIKPRPLLRLLEDLTQLFLFRAGGFAREHTGGERKKILEHGAV